MKKKIVAFILVFALALALGIGGTVAWLTIKTESIVNTFTVGDINIEMTEAEGEKNDYEFKFVPGDTITKDPKVTVKANSEACYLFVKIDESIGAFTLKDGTKLEFDDFFAYSVDSEWTAGTKTEADNGNGVPVGVYFRTVDATGESDRAPMSVLSGDKVTVNNSVTKAMVNAMGTKQIDGTYTYDASKLPKLTFTAYAVQKDNVADAATAWDIAIGNN